MRKAITVLQDYVAGTDPTNVASVFRAGIELVGGMPHITWSPNLNTNGIVRDYIVWGKEKLTDAARWGHRALPERRRQVLQGVGGDAVSSGW